MGTRLSRLSVLNWIPGRFECAILFFKTCSAISSTSLVSWSCSLILNISVNLVSFVVHTDMIHSFVCNLKESYSSILNNFWYVLQSVFRTSINFSYTPCSVIPYIWLPHSKYFAVFLSCPLNYFAMHIKQNAFSHGFNATGLLSMLLQMLYMHIDQWEFSISKERLSGGHFGLSMSRSSWDQNNFERDGRPLRSFLLVFFIFSRAPLLNSVFFTSYYYTRTARMVIIGTPVFAYFMWNGDISLGGRIHKKIAFHAYLGRMYLL